MGSGAMTLAQSSALTSDGSTERFPNRLRKLRCGRALQLLRPRWQWGEATSSSFVSAGFDRDAFSITGDAQRPGSLHIGAVRAKPDHLEQRLGRIRIAGRCFDSRLRRVKGIADEHAEIVVRTLGRNPAQPAIHNPEARLRLRVTRDDQLIFPLIHTDPLAHGRSLTMFELYSKPSECIPARSRNREGYRLAGALPRMRRAFFVPAGRASRSRQGELRSPST
jgi:hypothetical protein